ncbi:MAG: site-specific integrase [Spirochaetes bacterium]|nr:site-specific integrase [Spirochaetota bacterium]
MSRRYQCIALAYFYTGARNSELRLVKLTDCEMRGSEVIIRIHGKGRRERFVSMPAEIYHDARTIFRGNVYLFETAQGRPYSRSMINNELTRQSSRTHRIHIHTLRHSAAMYQVGRGISIERVSKYLGHSSASTTATYYLHGDAPSAREQGFGEVGSILVSIEAARKQRKQSRSPWRRHNGRGSFQRGLARG